ncbi:hypothetical protein AHAS_Ahas10G0093800 [Arachis hypogaea]
MLWKHQIQFVKEMASTFLFYSLQHILNVASDIRYNKVNVHFQLIVLNAHTNISNKAPFSHTSYNSASSTIMETSLKVCYVFVLCYLI